MSITSLVLLSIAGLAVVFVIVVSLQPTALRIARGTVINAPAAAVFGNLNDFHRWEAWSPWEKMDSSMTRSFAGAAAGVGAIYSWVGNKKVGEGRMTIVDTLPAELVRIKLEFIKPFAATNAVEFTLSPKGGQTAIEWAMLCQRSFFFKAFGLFLSTDKMVGPDFERGLAQLKAVSEGKTKG